jgi:polar amino acid transport system substrate-binding protein
MLPMSQSATRFRHSAMRLLRRCVVSALLLMFILSHTATAGELKVVHSGNWPPYSGADLPGQGLAIEMVTTALQRAGYGSSVSVDSLERILEGSRTGVYDVFATPWYTLERDQYLHFSQPYLESSIHFIKRKDSDFAYTEFDELEGLRIGVIKGYAYDEDFNQSPTIEKVSAGNLEKNLRKLIAKEVDLTLDDERVLRYEIKRSMPDSMARLEIVKKPLVVRGVNIGVSRNNADHAKIVADFDNAIAGMKQDGTYEEILKKHR